MAVTVGCQRPAENNFMKKQLELERETNTSLNADVEHLKGERDSAVKEKDVLASRVENLQNIVSNLVEITTSYSNKLVIATEAKTNVVVITETNTITATVTVANTVLVTNTVAPTASVATTATNATANGVIAVVTSANNSVVFYADGSIKKTNAPVGMVDGLPVLVDNVSQKKLALVLKRLAKPGSITLDIESGNYLTVFLLQGQYECTWRIKGQFAVAGSCTLTVNDGSPTDLVMGKGAFNGTLTLVDR